MLAAHTALLTTAGQLLGELAALDSDSGLRRKLRLYAGPDLLIIDEVGWLLYSNRHADLLFELVSRRYQNKSPVVTPNRAFADWGEVFRNAACVVSSIDRLMDPSSLRPLRHRNDCELAGFMFGRKGGLAERLRHVAQVACHSDTIILV